MGLGNILLQTSWVSEFCFRKHPFLRSLDELGTGLAILHNISFKPHSKVLVSSLYMRSWAPERSIHLLQAIQLINGWPAFEYIVPQKAYLSHSASLIQVPTCAGAKHGTWESSSSKVKGTGRQSMGNHRKSSSGNTQCQGVCCKPWAFHLSSCHWRSRGNGEIEKGTLGRAVQEKLTWEGKGGNVFSLQLEEVFCRSDPQTLPLLRAGRSYTWILSFGIACIQDKIGIQMLVLEKKWTMVEADIVWSVYYRLNSNWGKAGHSCNYNITSDTRRRPF